MVDDGTEVVAIVFVGKEHETSNVSFGVVVATVIVGGKD